MQETVPWTLLSAASWATVATTLLLLAAVWAVGYWLTVKNQTAWENRGFERFAGQWETIWAGSVLVGGGAAIAGGLLSDNLLALFIFGVFGFVMAFTGWTDLWVRKAPLEISHLGLYVLFPISLFGLLTPGGLINQRTPYTLIFGANDNLYQFLLFAAIMPVLLYVLGFAMGGNAVGMADIRGLWLVAFGFGWWYGFEYLLLLSIGSMLIQILAAIPANIFDWGVMKKSPLPRLRGLINRLYQRVTGSKRLLWADRSRAIPWLPAISFTFVLGSLIGLALPTLNL